MEALMGSDSLGGPRTFSSTSASSSTSSCSNCQQVLIIDGNLSSDEGRGTSNRRESESYVAVKGQSLIVTKREGQKRGLSRRPSAITLSGSPPTNNLVDSPEEGSSVDLLATNFGSIETQTMSEIERHLHQMTQLLRPKDSIKLVVRLESLYTSRIRYLAVVSCMEQEMEEFCLLGIDCQGDISLGLVLAILSHSVIRLDGDGGFCVTYGDGLRSYIFKPVSVQTMWSALQSLYQASECAKKNNSFQVSAVRYYDSLFQANKSELGCLNEWNVLPGFETKRPLIANMSTDEISFQEKISSTLREILLSERDLDEVTSKEIRTKLEHKLHKDLSNYKPFIDEEMLKILGQMEAPAMILENLYLGTEWNASHQQDLFDKDIGYILNVTAEIDNFFPDTFRYMNIPVIDNEETDLLRYFNDSYRFINEAHKKGKNVLVHCKMGISRSATIVVAYVMKNRNWNLLQSLDHVKHRRTCVNPNPNFMKQLEVYEGILTAKRFSDTLEKRSMSESNLKQRDFSLASPQETNISSSNGHLSHPTTLMKSPKKYYNTAPARLKPKNINGDDSRPIVSIANFKSALSRPKSSSCSAIPSNDDSKGSKDNNFVERDVLDSFHNAVQSLEMLKPSFASKPNTLEFTKQPDERSSLPNITDCWSVPIVTVSADKISNFVSKETFVFNNTSVSSEETETQSFEPLASTVSTSHSAESEIDDVRDSLQKCFLKIPNSPDSLNPNNVTTVSDDADLNISSSDQVRTRKNTNLKCCRRPFNGHTFSVSPNQVVNITSIANSSKFSVRNLVNEFESHSNRNSLTTYTPTVEIPCFHTASAILVVTNPLVGASSERKLSLDTYDSSLFDVHTGDSSISVPKSKNSIDVEIAEHESLAEKENASVNDVNAEESPKIESFNPKDDDSSSDKESKIGCLSFFKGHSASASKHDRSAKEAASNTIVRLIKSHSKRSEQASRSRDKVKDRGNRSKSKLLHSATQGKSGFNGLDNAVVVKGEGGNMSSGVFQKTGVVKQRLQAFEAKSVSPVQEQQHYNRSHNRSHSATGPPSSAVNLFSKDSTLSKFSVGHKRKSSMPHLNSLITDSQQSISSLKHTAPNMFDRKGSLDSNTLLRSIPNMNNRSFTVRGFQPPATQPLSNKVAFSSGRQQRNSFGFSSSSGSRQQHGSTHPLKLLPQTTKLSQ